jgi:replicative DNA helicase
MPKQCLVYNVFIAFPSDVKEEVAALKEVVSNWNSVNYETFNVMLHTIDWVTDSYPEMGNFNDPQGIVNKQVLNRGDILIGIFWCRIGTKTKNAVSGTVEEIDAFIQAEKPTMLYFSSKPINPHTIDQAQLNGVKEMKEKYKEKGVVWNFSTISEFKESLNKHLTRCVRDYNAWQDDANKKINDTINKITSTAVVNTKPIYEYIIDSYRDVENTISGKSKFIQSGFKEIDEMIDGFRQKHIYLIAGDRYGKTTFLKSMLANICVNNKIPSSVFTNDGNGSWFCSSMLSGIAGVNHFALSNGMLAKRDLPKLSFAAGPLSEAPLFLNDDIDMTFEAFEKTCNKLHKENKLGILLIDNLHMFNCNNVNIDSIAQLTKSLKTLAVKLNIPVIITAKLNEKIKQFHKRPIVSDLKEKYGDIEDYVDTIIFLYHDLNETDVDGNKITEFIIAKNNNGPIGTAYLLYNRGTLLFKNIPNDKQDSGF